MKFKEFLNEQSFSLKHSKQKILNVSIPLGTHLIKLIVFKKNQDTSKWLNECKNFLQNVLQNNIKNQMKLNFFDLLFSQRWSSGLEVSKLFKSFNSENFKSLYAFKRTNDVNATLEELKQIMHTLCEMINDDKDIGEIMKFLTKKFN